MAAANALLADLDFDGKLEINFDTISTQGWIFRHDGSIYRKMNNRDFGPDSKNLAVYIGYLRRKTEAAGEDRLIHTVRGVGYTARAAQ